MSGGQSSTLGQGSVALGLTLALVGSAVTASQGVVVPGSHGQVITISQGTLTAVSSGSVALSGSASTTSAGTLSPKNTPPALTGQALTASAGTATAQGNDLTLNITGEELEFAAGFVGGGYQFISGSALTAAQGSPVWTLTLPLSGQASTCSAGSVAPDQSAVDTRIDSGQGSTVGSFDVALSGISLTGSQGTVSVTADSDVALIGTEVTVSAGTIGIEEAYPLTGSAVTLAQESIGAPGGATLSGSEVTVSAGDAFTTNDRSYNLSGISVSVLDGSAVTSYLAFATGQELAVGQQGLGPRAAALTGASVSVDQGRVSPPEPDPVGGGGGHKPPHKKPHKKPHRHKDEDPLVQHHTGTLEHGSAARIRGAAVEKIAEQIEKKKRPDDDEDEALLLL